LSQGTLTYFGNATVLPDEQSTYEFRVVPTVCEHSRLLVWDEQRLVTSIPIATIEVERDLFKAKKFANVDFK
jgi:hypothetical protein